MALSMLSPMAAFVAPALPLQQVSRSGDLTMAVSKPSNAMPFLTAASCQSSGLPGAETGFDPLYLSDFMDIKWLREAELKHGRICMIAATGYIVQELVGLPGYPGYTPNPVEAFSSVPPEALGQIFGFMALVEWNTNKGAWTMSTMFEDKSRVPGNLGFDPLKFGENTETRERLEMAELKNGRLAMLAFAGMIHQTFVTGKPILASLGDIFASP
uniref:Chlorophyll a-b binding protein, chloroplastic n=1 Tax=Haptolina ericina TaxID=156174 RepID=A0A7S3ETC3_9EUKA|mmetsp:Transcript_22151/g.50002  ORF Transcript_22151/g.50002 Transcript_22151/m.50002 type:complete len:214 (+) Transcript_22151:17-658(+)|eukprot:CAMPEP_0181193200 /NCGR_PEP_ID=MMETSP1096-20121128/13694_1 /TAXON_ID=156174 ORGANISM="Chrysochromulina ericina, Strain CCMP281" /NCGR_SAMPLE_ID=MMETSP1096 /ASSEMBLY_ACC=CAM_ASM_000453 /LENGTH=213 /DNA_ID=CAMNT_0023282655 /DNA_START=21 /DNA_END=662 /DNA_ORIENTATION=+